MLSCHRYWGILLAISGLVLAGCKTPVSQNQPSGQESSLPGVRSTSSSVSTEKLAEAHAHYATAIIDELNEDTEAALDEYCKAAMADPDDEALVLEVSKRLLQNKQPEKALEVLNAAAARPNASGPILARLGLVYGQLGKTDQAIAANRSAIKRAPDSLAGYQNLFVLYLQGKQEAEAVKVLDAADKRPNPDAEFLIGLSELYANYGLQSPSHRTMAEAKALDELNRAEKLKPTNPMSKLRLADGFSQFGSTDKAAQLYLELLKNLPDLPLVRDRVHARLADIYLRSSDHKKAVEQLEALVHDDPTNPQAYYWLGRIAYFDKRYADAVEYFSKTVLLSRDMEEAFVEEAYYNLANAQMELKKSGDALTTLEQARRRFPQSFQLEVLTAMAFSQQKAYTEALQHYTSAEVIAQATDPKLLDYIFYFQIGATSERKGDYMQAEKYFQKCLKLSPDFAEAQNYLGFMWAEHGRNLDAAKVLIEKAVKAEPTNAAYLDSLGWVLFKLNEPKQALDYLLQAVKLSEEPDATVFDHLGDVYAALHERDKAQEAWRKSLSLEQNDDVRKKLGPEPTGPKASATQTSAPKPKSEGDD
jgi:tetratricopeptide (TPR) repeat protein